MIPASPAPPRAFVSDAASSPRHAASPALGACIDLLADTLGIHDASRETFQDLVALMAWQRGQPHPLIAPAPFDCSVAAPRVTLDDAVLRHHLGQMTPQDPADGLSRISQCLAGYDAGCWNQHAANRGIAPDSGFNDWPDTIKAAALRSICLYGADLRTLDVDAIDLRGIDMEAGSVDRSEWGDIPPEPLTGFSLPCAAFDRATLVDLRWRAVPLGRARFNHATLNNVHLSLADASDTQFVGARLSNVVLNGDFRRADFSLAQGDDILMAGVHAEANFSGARLTDVRFFSDDTPDFTAACFDGTTMTLSEAFLQKQKSLHGVLAFAGSPDQMTLSRTINSIDDRWVATKVGLMRQVLEVFAQWGNYDAAMVRVASAPAAFHDALCGPFYAEHAPFVADFINRHVLPAMATVPGLIQPVLAQHADALLRHWTALVTTAPWDALAQAQPALQRVLHVSAGLPGNAHLRQAWVDRPEVSALLTPEARTLTGSEGHVLVLGEAALVYDRHSFGAEFMRMVEHRSDPGEAQHETNDVAVFARGDDGRVQRQRPMLADGTAPDVSRWAWNVLVDAPQLFHDEQRRDVMLNHRNNEDRSWLRSIDAITGCDALTLGLMSPLVAAVERGLPTLGFWYEVGVARSMADILLDNPLYAACPRIAAFNQQHLLPALASHWSRHVLSAADAEQPNIRLLAHHLTERMPSAEWEILRARQFAVQQISALTGDPALRLAWQQRPEVAPAVRALNQLEEGLADISQVLVDDDGCRAMAYEDEAFAGLLASSDRTQWNRAYVFDADVQTTVLSNVPLDDLQQRLAPFPVLGSSYRAAGSTLLANLMAATIPAAFAARFQASALKARQTDKLLEPAQQDDLMRGLLPHLQPLSDSALQGWGPFDTARLRPAHARLLADTYRDETNGAVPQGALMLGLARLFIEFSSSHRFGRELDSPQALRVYAMALLSEVEAQAPALLSGHAEADGRPVLVAWKQRLQGLNGAFSCTAALSSALKHVIDQLDPAVQRVCTDVFPRAWR